MRVTEDMGSKPIQIDGAYAGGVERWARELVCLARYDAILGVARGLPVNFGLPSNAIISGTTAVYRPHEI